MSEVDRTPAGSENGEPVAGESLLPLVYDELRKLAALHLAREKPGQTLQATALVHEVYLRLAGSETPARWSGRGHFFGAAAEAMRRILVDNARRKNSGKRGGGRERVDLDAVEPSEEAGGVDLIALDEALDRLAALDPRKAELVKLRYFAGLTIEEAADVLGVSRATAARHWRFAKAWLFSELRDSPSDV